jgi:sterol desaturase/sphingolipid hydroxylase (fatty acid hydroxylase superfamily)
MEGTCTRRQEEPIRLFRSDFLEFFTHVHPITVLVIWVPVFLYFLVRGILDRPAAVPAGLALGIFLWTLTEYILHRFVFHFHPRAPWQERIAFLFHGVHHAQPMVKTRLVMPPAVSIPLAVLFYLLFRTFFDGVGLSAWFAPVFAGFVAGYISYDMIHYATHHFPVRGYFRFLKLHHMRHHFKTPDQRFGVSSPLWDWVFRTLPAD